MRTATIHEIKKELNDLEPAQVKELCIRLARFKKDNKELLTYLLFESGNEPLYIEQVNAEITSEIKELKVSSLYYLKKGLRRILRVVNRQIRNSGLPQTEVEIRLHFCEEIKRNRLPVSKSTVMQNLYSQQVKNIRKALARLHEDLQYDYRERIESLD